MHGSQGREEVVVVVVGRSTSWKHNSQTYDYCFNQILLECGKRFVVSWWHCDCLMDCYFVIILIMPIIIWWCSYVSLDIFWSIANAYIFLQILQRVIYFLKYCTTSYISPAQVDTSFSLQFQSSPLVANEIAIVMLWRTIALLMMSMMAKMSLR